MTKREVALVLVALTSMQLGAALAGLLFEHIGSGGATALRLGFSGLILLVAIRPRVWLFSGRAWMGAVTLGLCIAGMNGFFYEAIARIPLGIAVAIQFSGPLLLALLSSRRVTEVLPVGLAAAGIGIFGLQAYGEAATLDSAGVVFALIAGVFWALYIHAAARTAALGSGLEGLAVAAVIAGLLTFGLAVPVAAEVFTPEMLGAGVVVAILASVVPVTCEMAALRTLPKRIFSVLIALEPGVGALAGYLVLGQTLTYVQGFAIALVVIAAALVTARGTDPEPLIP